MKKQDFLFSGTFSTQSFREDIWNGREKKVEISLFYNENKKFFSVFVSKVFLFFFQREKFFFGKVFSKREVYEEEFFFFLPKNFLYICYFYT
jgi:hypothetical protein